ncbi:hypothetical protein [Flavobacterium lacisediminis]|uniref:Swt1-like HEPN domain-containing protein n=1 Tax=Flavobacterium lacisediminis TaxID=2989705 RepID=A0ABT3EIY4_9FLAO|nr:hypothetical protein [Flavobacterium lacisediminis]MCW1148527.1 hypothetical protein [Flavobacterium lacisediminis]
MGFSSQSFNHYLIAKKAFEQYSEPNDALITIMFSTMFIEAVLNDTICGENLTHELLVKNNIDSKELDRYKFDFDIYQDQIAFYYKIEVLFEKNGKQNFTNDIEYIELKHLVSLRNSIAHLKPIIKDENGFPKNKISKSALNYLKQKKMVNDPYGIGVDWIDRISNKQVSEWALTVTKQTIEYLYNSTCYPPLGIPQLDFYCLKLSIGKYKNI